MVTTMVRSMECSFASTNPMSDWDNFFCSSERRQNSPDPLCKLLLTRDQAHHQISIAHKIKKVPWMSVNILLRQQLDGEFLVTPRRRHAQRSEEHTSELQ